MTDHDEERQSSCGKVFERHNGELALVRSYSDLPICFTFIKDPSSESPTLGMGPELSYARNICIRGGELKFLSDLSA